MRSKAEISMPVVVMAIIALLVLVVLIFIFSGRIGGVNAGFGDCLSKNGRCIPLDSCQEQGGSPFGGGGICEQSGVKMPNTVCCIGRS
ncbi:MAG: hypothetical protein ABIC95_01140 [archaeon]